MAQGDGVDADTYVRDKANKLPKEAFFQHRGCH